MRNNEVEIGSAYVAKVCGQVVPVTILRESPYGGWIGPTPGRQHARQAEHEQRRGSQDSR